MASKCPVYLLCVALLLLPAHVCLGFWDRSLGLEDHTCRERELSAQPSLSEKKKKNKTKMIQTVASESLILVEKRPVFGVFD